MICAACKNVIDPQEIDIGYVDLTRKVMDELSICIEFWDEDMKLFDCNWSVLEFFGLKSKREYIERFEELCPEYQPCGTLSREKIKLHLKQAFEKGLSVFERIHMLPGGELVTVQAIYFKVFHHGKSVIVGYTIDLRDVQSSREFEQRIAKMNEMLLKKVPLLIEFVDCDDQFNVFDCNKKLLESFGLTSKEEYVARFDELHPEFQPCGTPSLELRTIYNKKALQDGYVQFEYMHLTANGEPLPVETTIVRLDIKDKSILVCFNHDLRMIKNEMQKTQKSEEKARLMLRVMPIGCVLLNKSYEIIDFNKAILDLTFNSLAGREQSQEINRCTLKADCTFVACCHNFSHRGFDQCLCRQFFVKNYPRSFFPNAETDKDALEIIEMHCKKAEQVNKNGGIYSLDYDLNSLYGEIVPCTITILPVDIGGENIYACYIIDLRHERQRQAAENENLSKTRFLAYMSHEIRTPINSVLGIAEIQLQNETLSPEIHEDFLRIHNSARILLSIINDILDLSKAAAGKMEIINQPYQLSSVIVGSVQLSLIHYVSTNIAFILNVDESLPAYLIGDELRISQIIANLLTNALKYTDKGIVSLNIGFEQAAGRDFWLIIEVRDTGKGMTKEQQDMIFEEFTRFNLKEDRYISGIGLGIPITSKLLQLMGGEMIIDSKLGKGSVFTVKIPQKVNNSQAIGKGAVERIKMLCSSNRPLRRVEKIKRRPMPYGRVLIVDDLESNRHVAQLMILPYKINIQTAESGEEAVSRIKSGEIYDIIFMDHMMPGMDGMEAVKIIRDMGYTFPIIALTANAVKGMEELFMGNGFSGFISKPVSLKTMDEYLMRYIYSKQPPEVLEAAEIEAVIGSGANEILNYTKSLFEPFLVDAARAIDNIELLLEKQEWSEDIQKAYILQVHNIKGTLANIGDVSFSEEAQILEQAGRDGDIDTIFSMTPHFLDGLKKLMAAFEPNKPDLTPEAVSGQDLEKLRELLSALSKSCQNYDIDSINSMIDSLKALPCPQEMRALIDEIKKHLLHGAFEEAGEIAGQAAQKM